VTAKSTLSSLGEAVAGAAVVTGSLTAPTVTVARPTSVLPWPSSIVYSNVAVPLKSAVGVKVTTPAVTLTDPLVAFPAETMVIVSPASASVSLPVSSVEYSESSSSVAVRPGSSLATGGSFWTKPKSTVLLVSLPVPAVGS
jgi:hypothetical protein